MWVCLYVSQEGGVSMCGCVHNGVRKVCLCVGPYVSQEGGVAICEPRGCVCTVYVNREGVSIRTSVRMCGSVCM